MLLLLAQDLQLEEQLLLLQQSSIRGVHQSFTGLLLLVRRNILVVLELFHPWLGLFALLTAALLCRCLLLALLFDEKQAFSSCFQIKQRDILQMAKKSLTFTSVGPGFEGAAVVMGWAGVTAGRLAGGSLVEITFAKSDAACVAAGKA